MNSLYYWIKGQCNECNSQCTGSILNLSGYIGYKEDGTVKRKSFTGKTKKEVIEKIEETYTFDKNEKRHYTIIGQPPKTASL